MSDALLLIDVQDPWSTHNPETLRRIRKTIPDIRRLMPVFAVFKGGRRLIEKYPEGYPPGYCSNIFQSVCPAVRVAPEDMVFLKGGADAFGNRSLAAHLRRVGVQRLFLAGFMAGECIYDTAEGAVRSKFKACVVSNLVADASDKINNGNIYPPSVEVIPHL